MGSQESAAHSILPHSSAQSKPIILNTKQEVSMPPAKIILSELRHPNNQSLSDSTTAIVEREGEIEIENISNWKAGRQQWSIVVCLLIINVIIVSDIIEIVDKMCAKHRHRPSMELSWFLFCR